VAVVSDTGRGKPTSHEKQQDPTFLVELPLRVNAQQAKHLPILKRPAASSMHCLERRCSASNRCVPMCARKRPVVCPEVVRATIKSYAIDMIA
jgi:hypothetical protein